MPEANASIRVAAIVPAAGRSRRMGRDKQLLDVAGQSMLAGVLDVLERSRVSSVTLVTHSGITAHIETNRFAKLSVVINDDEQSHMIDSVRMGIDAACHGRVGRAMAPNDGFLILPADHPGIEVADIDRCIARFSTDATRIVIATHNQRRGHPMIFPASLAPFVKSDACDAGLNALPRTHADRVVTIPCGSPGVTRDIDTPDDYDRLAQDRS